MKQLLFIACMLCSLTLPAQDMKSLFIELPDSLSPLLTKVNREDFGDFLASNMKAEVRNRFGKTSEMITMTDDYLKLRVSSVSTAEMKLLPVNDSVKVICVVRTYTAPAADSQIEFYNTSWEELPLSDFLTLPSEDSFYKHPQSASQTDSLRNLRASADMYLLKAELSEENPVLTLTYTTPDYMDEETAGKLRAYLVATPLRYKWKDGKFVPSL